MIWLGDPESGRIVIMPKPYPKEFKDDVVRVAQQCDHDVTIAEVAEDFGIHEGTLTKWMRQADLDSGNTGPPAVPFVCIQVCKRLHKRREGLCVCQGSDSDCENAWSGNRCRG